LSVGRIVPHKSLQTGQQWRDATRRAAGLKRGFSECLCAPRALNGNDTQSKPPRLRPRARLFNYLITLSPDFHRAVRRESEPFIPGTENRETSLANNSQSCSDSDSENCQRGSSREITRDEKFRPCARSDDISQLNLQRSHKHEESNAISATLRLLDRLFHPDLPNLPSRVRSFAGKRIRARMHAKKPPRAARALLCPIAIMATV